MVRIQVNWRNPTMPETEQETGIWEPENVREIDERLAHAKKQRDAQTTEDRTVDFLCVIAHQAIEAFFADKISGNDTSNYLLDCTLLSAEATGRYERLKASTSVDYLFEITSDSKLAVSIRYEPGLN